MRWRRRRTRRPCSWTPSSALQSSSRSTPPRSTLTSWTYPPRTPPCPTWSGRFRVLCSTSSFDLLTYSCLLCSSRSTTRFTLNKIASYTTLPNVVSKVQKRGWWSLTFSLLQLCGQVNAQSLQDTRRTSQPTTPLYRKWSKRT